MSQTLADCALDAYDGRDWNGALGRPQSLPKDNRKFWIVTEDVEVVQVQYDSEASFWLPGDHYSDIDDPERGRRFDTDQIMGWTDDYEAAEDAAAQFEEHFL